MMHLLSIDDLNRDDIERLLNLADSFAEVQSRSIPKVPALRGKTVVLAFYEDSTRTRTSFDLAARRLSADVVNFAAGSSSAKKGESLRDTVETISAMGVDAIIVRHASSGVPFQFSQWTDASIINAGDGWHQHPTQALLDTYTLTRRLGSLDGKNIAMCGDINHSRVARSNVAAFTKMGAEVILVGPQTLMPPNIEGWPVSVETDFDAVIGEIDVAYMLRIQQERLSDGLFPTVREYRDRYGLTSERAKKFSAEGLIMHPGPMNRGVEIDPAVADDSRSVVLDQVASGVPIRMATLYQLLGPSKFEETDSESTDPEVGSANTGSANNGSSNTATSAPNGAAVDTDLAATETTELEKTV